MRIGSVIMWHSFAWKIDSQPEGWFHNKKIRKIYVTMKSILGRMDVECERNREREREIDGKRYNRSIDLLKITFRLVSVYMDKEIKPERTGWWSYGITFSPLWIPGKSFCSSWRRNCDCTMAVLNVRSTATAQTRVANKLGQIPLEVFGNKNCLHTMARTTQEER